MSVAVGVVFSPGGRVYSFDPDGLELGWNERVVCQTGNGQALGRGVKAKDAPRATPARVGPRALPVAGRAGVVPPLVGGRRERQEVMPFPPVGGGFCMTSRHPAESAGAGRTRGCGR